MSCLNVHSSDKTREGEIMEEKEEPEEETIQCSVKPDEVPQVPENKFLYRSAPEFEEKTDKKPTEDTPRRSTRDDTKRGRRTQEYDADGKKVKGRGTLVSHVTLCYIMSCNMFHLNRDIPGNVGREVSLLLSGNGNWRN